MAIVDMFYSVLAAFMYHHDPVDPFWMTKPHGVFLLIFCGLASMYLKGAWILGKRR